MIEVEGLTRRYGDFTAVDDVGFSIGDGEIVGLLGHNGAGKTTIMKMLTGFLEPSAGVIRINGMDIASQRREVQALIGYLPENCPLYLDMTVIDFLDYAASLHGLPAADRPAAVRDAIGQTELGDKAMQPIATLSRGYRQRVGVAQAILHKPKIVILDEPTNGLDPSQIHHMRDLVRRLAKSATVILSTHILQEVQAVCGRVIIIRAGRIAHDSPLADVRASHRLLVAVDGAPDAARPRFVELACVDGVEYLGAESNRHRYALSIKGAAEDAAPEVAGAVVARGMKLFNLQREQRDLEALFAEINSPREAVNA